MNTDNIINHTPGPWKLCHTPTRKETFWTVVTANGAPIQAVICLVDAKSKAHQENLGMDEQNARLIAAAPELLEALKVAQAVLGDLLQSGDGIYVNARRMINAAIAKATLTDGGFFISDAPYRTPGTKEWHSR